MDQFEIEVDGTTIETKFVKSRELYEHNFYGYHKTYLGGDDSFQGSKAWVRNHEPFATIYTKTKDHPYIKTYLDMIEIMDSNQPHYEVGEEPEMFICSEPFDINNPF